MNTKLDEKLCKKYPKIFSQRNLPMTETLMCWGFECGDGWYWLIDNLCGAIQSYCDCRNEGVRIRNKARKEGRLEPRSLDEAGEVETEFQVEAVQVKEKFGGLRFYIQGGDDQIYGMIDFAEHLSKGICEMCGTTEDIHPTQGGWVKYLCPKCMEGYES